MIPQLLIYGKWINRVIGPLLFALVTYSIYQNLVHEKGISHQWESLQRSVESIGVVWLILAVLLVVVNWGLETLKWQKLMQHIFPISFGQAFSSVLVGVSFTMLTPNRTGEFVGRALYMPDGSRIKSAVLASIGSLSQIMVTLIGGLAGLAYILVSGRLLGEAWTGILLQTLLYGTIITLTTCSFVYYNLGYAVRLIERWKPMSKYRFAIHAIGEIKSIELTKILGLSAARFVTFLTQYYFIAYSLGMPITLIQCFAATSLTFLILAIIPTISLAELGIRGKISLHTFGIFTNNSLAILALTATVLAINIILPSLIGSIKLLTLKIVKRKQDRPV